MSFLRWQVQPCLWHHLQGQADGQVEDVGEQQRLVVGRGRLGHGIL